MKAAAVISCLAALANGAAVKRSTSPLDVKIEQVGNSEVKASITNTGSTALRVLKTGSILDSSSTPIERVRVSQAGVDKVPFTGIRVFIDTSNLVDSSFQTIAAGETVEVQWDAALTHDLSAGGAYSLSTAGSLQYAEDGSNRIAGQVVYGSEAVEATIDGSQAGAAHAAFHASVNAKRVTINGDCSSSQKTTINSALTAATNYAKKAQAAATAGTKMSTYFKSTSSSTTSKVSSVFSKVASQLSSGSSGAVALHCADIGQACTNGVVAYTQPGANEYIVVCPYWFQFPASTTTCHAADRPYVLVHEATHLVAVAGTDDVCYGYDGCVTSISAAQELNNADTYALYANAIAVNC